MRTLIAALAVSALVVTPALADSGGASGKATTFKKCAAPANFPEDGGSFSSLSAGSGVKCTSAASIATAWAKCAAANGKGGRCVKKVKGYGCAERSTTSGTVRTSSVTCKKKKALVRFGVSRSV
jgi:hypothetical protein